MLRSILIPTLALLLSGCATTSAPPGGAIARLSPDELARMLPKPEPRLPTAELVRMSKEGATAQDIIAKIRQTGSSYALGAAQLIELHGQGLSTEVLDYIQAAREQALRDRMADEINQREQRHAEELQREQASCPSNFYHDPWWPGYPGCGWNFAYPLHRHWRR